MNVSSHLDSFDVSHPFVSLFDFVINHTTHHCQSSLFSIWFILSFSSHLVRGLGMEIDCCHIFGTLLLDLASATPYSLFFLLSSICATSRPTFSYRPPSSVPATSMPSRFISSLPLLHDFPFILFWIVHKPSLSSSFFSMPPTMSCFVRNALLTPLSSVYVHCFRRKINII